MTAMLIGPAEKLDALQQARRTALLALADYLTGLPVYPDPWDLFAAYCPGVPLAVVEDWASELLRITCRPGVQDEHWTNVVLDHLTGVRP